MTDVIPMTREGYNKIKAEVKRLEYEEMPIIVERIANARAEDSVLFKLSNRVRGSGKVGEMGTLLAEAFKADKTAPLAERLAYLGPTAGEERVGALLDRLRR